MSPTVILYIVLAIFAASAGGGIVYTYNHAIVRAEKAESDNTQLRADREEQTKENTKLRDENIKMGQLLAVRQAQRNVADALERKVNSALSKLLADPQVRSWADAPVPQSVLGSLRNAPEGTPGIKDGKAPATGKPAPDKPGR